MFECFPAELRGDIIKIRTIEKKQNMLYKRSDLKDTYSYTYFSLIVEHQEKKMITGIQDASTRKIQMLF